MKQTRSFICWHDKLKVDFNLLNEQIKLSKKQKKQKNINNNIKKNFFLKFDDVSLF